MEVTELAPAPAPAAPAPAAPAAAAAAAPAQVKADQVNLQVNLQFLINVRNIIDISVKRATWKPTELTSVGKLYENLDSTINSAIEQVNQKLNPTATEEVVDEALSSE